MQKKIEARGASLFPCSLQVLASSIANTTRLRALVDSFNCRAAACQKFIPRWPGSHRRHSFLFQQANVVCISCISCISMKPGSWALSFCRQGCRRSYAFICIHQILHRFNSIKHDFRFWHRNLSCSLVDVRRVTTV